MAISPFWQSLLGQIPILTIAGFVGKTLVDNRINKLRTELSVKNQHKLTIKKFEVETVFEYDKILSKWILSLFYFNPHTFNGLWDYKELRTKVNSIKALRADLNFQDSYMEVFITDNSFIETKNTLLRKVYFYEGIIDKEIGGLIELYKSYDTEETYHASHSEDEYEGILNSLSENVSKFKTKFYQEHQSLRDECKELFKNYKTDVNRIIKSVGE